MNASTPRLEGRYLLASCSGNLVIAVVGLVVASISASQAILLDGAFNLTYLAMGLFTLRVAGLVQRGDDRRFPAGYAYFEPLVNGIKGVLVLGVSLMALAGAVEALLTGGRTVAAGPAVGYGVFATVICAVLAIVARRGAQRTGSPLLQVDAENWTVNAAISACVLAAFIVMAVMRGTRLDGLVPYVDPGLVLTVVLISIGIPVRMAWSALMQLLNRAPAPEIVERVTTLVHEGIGDLPAEQIVVRVIETGRTRTVFVHVTIDTAGAAPDMARLDAVRAAVDGRLRSDHAATIVDVLFTGDARWGAPLP